MTKLTGSLGVRNEINVDIIGTGARGKEGKSAYEIWLDLGNEGTEQEYLASLKGQDGDVGPKGDKGDKGDIGNTGKSLEFTWNGTQLGIRQEGDATFQYINLKGDKGDTGNTGKGLEFNWNGTQLGVRVEGDATYQYVNLKGDKGDTGAKGDKGDPGEVTAAELAAVTSQLAENADHAALWRTTTGNPVTCYPVPESPLYPKVSLVATQEGSGDPSPENIRPIAPSLLAGQKMTFKRTGKNRFDKNNLTKAYLMSSGNVQTNGGWRLTDYIPVNPSVDYYFISNSQTYDGLGRSGAWYDKNKNYLSDVPVVPGTGALDNGKKTTPANAAYVRLHLKVQALTDYPNTQQFELGSTPTHYEPYSSDTYEWTAPQDIYGLPGAETYVDWDAGELVVQDAMVVLDGSADEGWMAHSTIANLFLMYNAAPGFARNDSAYGLARCDGLRNVSYTNITIMQHGGFCVGNVDNRIAVKRTDCATVVEFKAALQANPITIQYKLATHIRIPLTDLPAINALPQLDRYTPRQNVLTVDKGSLTVGYAKSPIRESDELQAAIALK